MEKREKFSLIPSNILDNLPSMVRNELAKLPAQKQEEFLEEYKRKTKSISITYFLWLLFPFGGGFHYLYLGSWGTQFLCWLTLGGLGIWWIIDAFRIPKMVRDYNKDVAVNVLRNLKAISD